MIRLRDKINSLLNPQLAPHGVNQYGVDIINSTTQTQGGDNPDYIIRRLKRDAPTLAESVIRGDMSALPAEARPPRPRLSRRRIS